MSQAIPLVLAGKIPGHRAAVIEALKPEFEVIHECPNVESIKEYLAAMTESDRPAALIVGGGYSPAEFEEVRTAPGAEKIALMRADISKGPPSGGPPAAETVAKRARQACEDHKAQLSRREGAGQVWML